LRIWIIAAVVLVLDRISKLLIVAHLNINESLPLLQHFFHLTYVQNTGAAFGLFPGQTIYLVVLTLIGFAVAIILRKKIARLNKNMLICLGMIIGGALGNFIDRVYWGYVVDFIDFRLWPFIFNIADSTLVVGSLLLAIMIFNVKEPLPSQQDSESAEEQSAEKISAMAPPELPTEEPLDD